MAIIPRKGPPEEQGSQVPPSALHDHTQGAWPVLLTTRLSRVAAKLAPTRRCKKASGECSPDEMPLASELPERAPPHVCQHSRRRKQKFLTGRAVRALTLAHRCRAVVNLTAIREVGEIHLQGVTALRDILCQ